MSRSLLAALPLLLLLACERPPTVEPAKPVAENVLRIYDVPEAYQGEVRGVLSSLLYRGKSAPRAGNVALGPGGRVLVTSTPEFHAGVEELVARISKEPPTPPPTVSIEYEVLLGMAADTPTPADRFPESVRHVVDALQKRHGPMDLRPADRLQIRSLSGETADTQGPIGVRQEASVRGDLILASLNVRTGGGGEFNTRLQLPVGEVVVLGYAGVQGGIAQRVFPEYKGTGPSPTAFYIVRGTVPGTRK